MARNADPQDGEKALRLITRVACNEDFQLNATQMVELLSCGLSFAQWDDTRMFAYDALNSALDTMDRFAKEAKSTRTGDATAKRHTTMASSPPRPRPGAFRNRARQPADSGNHASSATVRCRRTSSSRNRSCSCAMI